MRNKHILYIVNLAPINEVMRSDHFRCFGHVQRSDRNNVTRRVMDLAVPGTTRRGRPTKTWYQQIKDDMMGEGVTKDMAPD